MIESNFHIAISISIQNLYIKSKYIQEEKRGIHEVKKKSCKKVIVKECVKRLGGRSKLK